MATRGQSAHVNFTSEEAEAIRNEMGQILRSAQFAGSKRCHDFLLFVVGRTLEGDTENLTERFIGADLFGRPLDYDTTRDSIVRVCANDVRRRLGGYNQHQSSPSRVTITLKSGSYLPEFHLPKAPDRLSPPTPEPPLQESQQPEALKEDKANHQPTPPSRKRLSLIFAAVALLGALGIIGAVSAYTRKALPAKSALDKFWEPVIQNRSSEVICFSDSTSIWLPDAMRQAIEEGRSVPFGKADQISITKGDLASAGNIRAAVSLMRFFDHRGVHNELRWPQEAQPSELETSNVIYVGAFSNPATMNLNENLRFSFKFAGGGPGAPVWMITDRNSGDTHWSTTRTYPAPVQQDYALIARVFDPERHRVVIAVGGLNWFGTQAAGEFLTDPAAMDEFARTAPPGWEHKNLQIVLQMGVTGRQPVNPRVVATNFW